MVLKLSENPPMLWPEETSIADFQGQWWVAHTKSRNEKALAWQLTNADVPYFLPMHWKVFPSYLFFCGSEDHRLAVLKTNRTANILPVEDQQLLVRELLPIETMLKLGKTVLPHEYIKIGQKYRVIAGPLQGAEGIVIATPKETRLILQIDMLGQAASVEIAADMIEKLDE
ncbi:MAG: transcription termination/antitermination protein NusG [Planctomycetota bacterium]|jgi:transcription antitermination factor NusG